MIAVDANGADRGPGAVAEGVAPLRAARAAVRAGRGALGRRPAGGGRRRPRGDQPATSRRRRRARAAATPRSCRPPRRWPTAAPTRSCRAGTTGPTLAAGTLAIKRIQGVYRPALAVLLPVPAARAAARRRRERRGAPRAPRAVRLHGRRLHGGRHGVERPRVGLLSVGEEAGKGTPGRARRARAAQRRARSNFVGNVEGIDLPAAGADVVVTDGFTGNVALKLMEGDRQDVGRGDPRRDPLGPVSTLGGLLIRGKLGGLRDQLDPERVGGAILLGLRRPVVVAHGSFGPRGIANAVAAGPTGRWTRTWSSARRRRSRPRGALRSAPAASVVARDADDPSEEVFERIRAHLAAELEVDPRASTRTRASRRTSRRTRSTSSSWWWSSRTATASASPTRRRPRS